MPATKLRPSTPPLPLWRLELSLFDFGRWRQRASRQEALPTLNALVIERCLQIAVIA